MLTGYQGKEKCADWHTTNMYGPELGRPALPDLGDAASPGGRNADGEGACQ